MGKRVQLRKALLVYGGLTAEYLKARCDAMPSDRLGQSQG